MMDVFSRLKDRLYRIGIYDQDAVVSEWELKAYASGFEFLYSRLQTMFRERFISTAQDIGLSAYEAMFGPVREDESIEQRRRSLLLRVNLNNSDFTVAGIKRALDSFGFSYTISEFPTLGRMNILATSDCSPAQQARLKYEVSKIIPAHIEFQLSFNSLTWDKWDALNRTFSMIDSEEQTWDQIDNRTQ